MKELEAAQPVPGVAVDLLPVVEMVAVAVAASLAVSKTLSHYTMRQMQAEADVML